MNRGFGAGTEARIGWGAGRGVVSKSIISTGVAPARHGFGNGLARVVFRLSNGVETKWDAEGKSVDS